jgi:hypothetical protein
MISGNPGKAYTGKAEPTDTRLERRIHKADWVCAAQYHKRLLASEKSKVQFQHHREYPSPLELAK